MEEKCFIKDIKIIKKKWKFKLRKWRKKEMLA